MAHWNFDEKVSKDWPATKESLAPRPLQRHRFGERRLIYASLYPPARNFVLLPPSRGSASFYYSKIFVHKSVPIRNSRKVSTFYHKLSINVKENIT